MTSDRGTSGEAELQLDTPVTPKSPHGLNPNASEFQSHKTSIPLTAVNHTNQWEDNNGVGNNMSSVSEYTFNVNDDVTWENAKVIYSPGLESTLQTFGTPFPEEQPYVVTEANMGAKMEEILVLDNTGTDYHMPMPGSYGVEGMGIQYNSDDRIEADIQLTDGNLPQDQLRHNVKSQLDSLFSRENLSNDSYLQSQMDADQYVPVTTVANLEQIRRLTNDLNLIVELLRESNFVQVDEKGEKVRPNHNRRIVILREIPDSTPIEEVQNLFSGEKCPKFVSCEFAHNDNWYVTFVSDLDAQHAYQYLREVVKTFQGKPIMARIKAKPLIPTYQARNGSIKPFQPPPVTPAQIPAEIVTSTHQSQFTASQPFTLINHVSQYLNGQQAIPFYPPPTPQLLPNWHGHIMEPSMVLAMNGYHATNVKVNNITNNQNHPFNINRSNYKNPKFHGGPPMGRDRINSNESLPPRLQHQHDRQHTHTNSNSVHKPDSQISNHGAQFYNSRRGEMNSGTPGIGGHGASNHTGFVGHNHHGNMMPHHQHNHQLQQQLDGNNNSNQSSSASNGAVVNSRTQLPPPGGSDTAQRFAAGKSYKNRRRREEDSARSNRSASQRDGMPTHLSAEKFDYEPTSFPPLPGAESNKSSNEVFESKLSDVVKGTAKQQIKETPPAKLVISQSTVVSSVSPGLTATTSTKTTAITATSKTSLPSCGKDIEASAGCSTSQQAVSVSSAAAFSKSSSSVTSSEPLQTSVTARNVKPLQTVPETKPSVDRLPKQLSLESLTNSDDKNASSAKPSYAEMVQRSKAIEISANSLADSDDSENTDISTQPSSRALNEQGQQQNQLRPATNRTSSAKDFVRKNSRESYDRRFDREREKDVPKESDSHHSEPREQRSNRKLKENRERRFGDREGTCEEPEMKCDESIKALEK